MKKLKLFGMKKDEERAEFIIEKSQAFVPLIRKLIKELTKEYDWNLFVRDDEKKGRCIDEKIKSWTDRCNHRKYKDYELDIFVGKSKILLVIHASIQNQKKFIDSLMKFYKWKK